MNINSLKPTTVLCYVRVSVESKQEEQSDSPERQRANIQRYCDDLGFTPEWYEDVRGHSSGLNNNRKAYREMLARIGDEDVVGIMVNEQTRLSREISETRDVRRKLDKHQKRLFEAINRTEINLKDASVRFAQDLKALLGENEAMQASVRARDSKRHRKLEGKTNGIPLFGLTRDKKGYLVRSNEGAWLLADGRYVAGMKNEPPEENAIWRGYYECMYRMMEVYADDKFGYARIADLLTQEGFRFRDRWGEPRLLESDDVRRVTANWRGYAGIIEDGRALSKPAYRYDTPENILDSCDPTQTYIPLDLLRQVAYIQKKRSVLFKRSVGTQENSYVYPLSKLVYCAHCEKIVNSEDNQRRHSRLSGSHIQNQRRYRHPEGVQCGCKRRSVLIEKLHDEVGYVIGSLNVQPEILEFMANMNIEVPTDTTDVESFETEKRQKIAKLRLGIANARELALSGDITHEEYHEIKARHESEIRIWEHKNHPIRQREIALSACLARLIHLRETWMLGDNKQKQQVAHALFENIVYDLDREEITHFRLQEWVHFYFEMVATLYQEGYMEFNVSGNVAICDPNEIRTRVFTLKG